MKKYLIMALALIMMLSLCACAESGKTDDSAQPTDPVATQPTATDPAPTQPAATDPAPTQPQGFQYSVRVVDEGVNEVPGAIVQICSGNSCMPGFTNEEGIAVITLQEERDDYHVTVTSLPEGYSLLDEENEYHFEEGSKEITIVVMYMPQG